MTFVEELSKYIYDNKRYISDIEYIERRCIFCSKPQQ